MKITFYLTFTLLAFLILGCGSKSVTDPVPEKNPNLSYATFGQKEAGLILNRSEYASRLEGFWLGTCIANWTGLVTEMDKVGDIGDKKTGAFYTREDWGKPDQPNIWSGEEPSPFSSTIDFVFADPDTLWGADDDTDIEYIYQELLLRNQTSFLTGEQIREGWLKHIKTEEENFLWVSNQKAFDLIREGLVPPGTGDPENNPEYEMIDAQLTTEIFGLYAPGRPDLAVKMAQLPIQTTARMESQWISEFYVSMFSLAAASDPALPIKDRLMEIAEKSKVYLPSNSYPAKMYDFVKAKYEEGISWEQARDSVYYRYQVQQLDGYDMTSRNLPCNACFAAGINFAASLVSLFYGEGDLIETIKIGALAGWDSDNPTATWGGLIGFMLGKEGVEEAFGRKFSDRFHIHRTRIGFEGEGIDTFQNMAKKGVWIVDRVVQEELQGGIDLSQNTWSIPPKVSN
ncbi:hypothetical protein Aoki45_17500 [Algoriphagus sp. oki45]|uniref:ADP-ribosylglycohydrolase family protein n=1 Tax=Algoriphagus sp. oki45 TaxID=3067294 RepID=UPI0027EE6453|nr:hypothetical protein Aoki45_17500 [Algoriphagus sp. oki45]